MGEIHPLLDFLLFVILLPTLALVKLLVHHLVYPIIDRYLQYIFTLVKALLRKVTFVQFLCRFKAILLHCRLPAFTLLIFHVGLRILSLISYSMMVGWSVLCFCLCWSHFSFFVIGKLRVMWLKTLH